MQYSFCVMRLYTETCCFLTLFQSSLMVQTALLHHQQEAYFCSHGCVFGDMIDFVAKACVSVVLPDIDV